MAESFCRIYESGLSSIWLPKAFSKLIFDVLGSVARLTATAANDLSALCPYAPKAQGVEK
jgi:hypothetical protein